MAPLSLPDPPPPAPARREAAIEAAMASFDGAERGAPVHDRPRPATRRPYLASAMALSLLALIVAPVAWMHRQSSTPEMPRRVEKPQARADIETPAAIPATPVEVKEEPPAAEPDKPAPLAETAKAPTPPPPSVQAPVQEKASGLAQGYQAMPAPPIAAPPAPAPAAPALAARAEARRARAVDSENSDDIIVTSARADPTLLRGRGDWNACTVQDPQKNLDACKRQIDPGAKGDKGTANAHMADGLTHGWQGDWRDAIAAFGQAIAAAPKSPQAYLNRGLAYQAEGEDDHALEDFDKAVRYAPHAARGYYHRSLLLRQRGEIRKANADRQRAAELDSRYDYNSD